jgi:hypothetical protein
VSSTYFWRHGDRPEDHEDSRARAVRALPISYLLFDPYVDYFICCVADLTEMLL